MRVVYGNGADVDGNFVSGFVLKKPDGVGGLGGLDGEGDSAIFAAEFAFRLVAAQQRLRDAEVAHDVMVKVAGDALGPRAP